MEASPLSGAPEAQAASSKRSAASVKTRQTLINSTPRILRAAAGTAKTIALDELVSVGDARLVIHRLAVFVAM